MMRKWMTAAAIAAGVLLGSDPVLAQPAPPPATRPVFATQEFEAFTFAPILINGECKGFFCFADPDLLVGDNIPMIWYDKGADGEWTMWGWQQYDLQGAIKWVLDHYGDVEVFKNYSQLCRVYKEESIPAEPRNMSEGLFVGDPMHQLIELADDPVAAMTLLESIGWEAAPGLSAVAVAPLDDSCDPNGVDPLKKLLDESAYKMEVIITGVATTSVDCFSFGCTGCIKNYDPMVPDANAQWIFRYSSTPSAFPNDKFCYYDFPATQHWWFSGQKTNCSECTGSGTDSTFIMKTVRVGRNEECHEPTGAP